MMMISKNPFTFLWKVGKQYKFSRTPYALALLFIIFTSSPAFAQTAFDHKSVNYGYEFFDPTSPVCGPGSGSISSGGTTGEAGTTFVSWSSGLQPPYIMEQYVIEILKYIADFKNAPREDVVTQEHTLALLAWAYGEGGDINNKSTFNLFNTSALRNDPEAMPYAAGGADGRLAYANFDVGIKATGGTMLLPRYTRVIDALLKKETTASQVLDAYAHYSRYPGNGWWAQQNEIDGEDAYYQKMLSQLKGFTNDYSRAATVIGTTEKELQTGQKDASKLTFSGAGAAAVSEGGGIGSGGACADSVSGGTIVEIAEREFLAGAKESDNSYHKYTTGNSEAWCAWFVSWVYKEAGRPFTGGIGEGGYAYPAVASMLAMAKEKNWFSSKADVVDGKFTPQPGDVAIYKEGVGDYPSHVNIVISYDNTKKEYTAIGGNEGDGIKKRTHSVSSGSLTGFMRPANGQ